MPWYVRMGQVPPKRHTQFRRPDGGLYAEEVLGTEGFSGIQSILYHYYPPTRVKEFYTCYERRIEPIEEPVLQHRHFRTGDMPPAGDAVTGRVELMFNENVIFSVARPAEQMNYFYKNADGDDLIFVHEGSGKLESQFGHLRFREGDYLVIPHGTIWRLVFDQLPAKLVWIEAIGGQIETPKRYRNEYGQLLEHSPYCERDIRVPEELETRTDIGDFEVRIHKRGRVYSYHYEHHPFDVVGWDGYVYPWAFNINDFEPITGRIHQPPPVHQTFEGPGFVVCSFCPRMLDYHPQAIPVPYNHSNLDSDEVLYYLNKKFGSRRGIEIGSITLHPSGIPHGPQPGAVEASLGKTYTEEMAVMMDTFRPLQVTKAALEFEDPDYPFSWLSAPIQPDPSSKTTDTW
ncbi:MAG: homogentisate 1,2-dioxygenase [Armatimonadota bacterium]|nr:homogentisate 1,2-dioxygenase [Armatimonadota bacterium]